MTFCKNIFLMMITLGMVACSASLSSTTSSTPTTNSGSSGPTCDGATFTTTSYTAQGTVGATPNAVTITVNGSTCGPAAYQALNEPCASVTICSITSPTTCQTINNLLVDTGSYGLRIFSSVINSNIALAPIVNGTSNLAECVQFGDGSSMWGQVEYAYVQLGSEQKVAVPIQVVNSSYATAPGPCTSSQSYPATDPASNGFNGILGVGLFPQDCGSSCLTQPRLGQYYTCVGSDCSCGASVPLGAQVANVVSAMTQDNNGIVMSLPSVISSAGVGALTGTMYLGIDTQANNTSTGYTKYRADGYGQFTTIFSGYSSTAMASFIDSGSNGLFFPAPTSGSLPDCSGVYGATYAGLFCPTNEVTLTATNTSYLGSTPGPAVTFYVDNAYTIANSSLKVWRGFGGNALGSGTSTPTFDWGLPFFFGRKVFVGIYGSSSSLGAGPYWAY